MGPFSLRDQRRTNVILATGQSAGTGGGVRMWGRIRENVVQETKGGDPGLGGQTERENRGITSYLVLEGEVP